LKATRRLRRARELIAHTFCTGCAESRYFPTARRDGFEQKHIEPVSLYQDVRCYPARSHTSSSGRGTPIATAPGMNIITGDYGTFLVKIQCGTGQYHLTIWDKHSVNPLGRVLASQSLSNDVDYVQAAAAEMLAELNGLPVGEIRRGLAWELEMAVK
jgi:hypothetical protein